MNSLPADILQKKIAQLEQEAAIRMAIDTFLDCNSEEVKVRRMSTPRPSEKTWAGLRQKGSIFNVGRQKFVMQGTL